MYVQAYSLYEYKNDMRRDSKVDYFEINNNRGCLKKSGKVGTVGINCKIKLSWIIIKFVILQFNCSNDVDC